ncbi:MAG: RNA 2',3'-cyclic phosphodiesterase [Candidatus Bathyarchaeia archaeon]
MRCFISVDLEDPGFVESVGRVQRDLLEICKGLKLVEPQNLHITLRFLGEIDEKTADGICKALGGVEFGPFEVELRGLGAFPKDGYANVIWIGIQGGRRELEGIARDIETRLRVLGIPPDERGFSPHLTIARVKSPGCRAKFKEFLSGSKELEFGSIPVDSIRLKRRERCREGCTYCTIGEARAK